MKRKIKSKFHQLLLGLSFCLVACQDLPIKKGFSISRPFPDHQKIRFDLENSEPLPELALDSLELHQDINGRFLARINLYAKQKLAELGLCPNGFIPAEYVLTYRDRRSNFVITCK
jgi:hypothetical protein